jgi:tetratricopeptide (TPR) repeat protein
MILGTYREAETTPGHPLFELLADFRRDRLFDRVALRGLDRHGVGAMIESRAGQAPSALVQAVHTETAGNPFFVEEVVLHLLETGAELDVAGIGVPEGVKEVLERRLSRLSDTCRAVLAHAAVLGREFRFDLLPAMAAMDDDTVIDALEEALAAQLIVEHGESVYAFTHALVRETLYGGLSAPRRQRIHALAALAIEAGEGPDADAQVAALAVHYRQAGPAVDPGKGIEYSLRAGERARQNFAWDEAMSHWDGALKLMERAGTDAGARVGLLAGLANLSTVVGDLDRQIEYLERALALCDELGDEERAAQMHSRLGVAHSLIDSIYASHMNIRRAFEHFDAARAVLERGPVRKALGHLQTGVATAWTYGAQTEAGLEAGAQAMEIGKRLGDEVLWAGAAQAYGWHKIAAGDLSEGHACVESGFQAADRAQRPFVAWMGNNIRGQLTWGLGDPDGAQVFFERHRTLAYAGETSYSQEVADGLGRCHASRGELDSARRLLSDARPAWITHSLQPLVDLWDGNWDAVDALAQRVLETSRRTGNRWDEWASQHLAARVLYLRGDLRRAADNLERARVIVRDGGARYFEMWVLPDLARVQAELGSVDDARVHADRCLEIAANGEDWRGRGGVAEVAVAVVLSFEERHDQADERFSGAIETLRRYRLAAEEADALHQWGLARARAGDSSGAADRMEQAAELYRRHGAASAWLDRLQAG